MSLLIVSMPCIGWSFDLEKVAETAFEIAYSLKSSEMEVRSAEAEASEKFGLMLPTLEIDTSFGAVDQIRPSKSYHRTESYSISMTQPIYDPDLWDDYEEADIGIRLSNNSYYQAKEELLLNIALQFLKICRLRAQQQIYRYSLNYTAQSVDIQKKMMSYGYGSKLSLLEANIEQRRYENELEIVGENLKHEIEGFYLLTEHTVDRYQIRAVESVDIDPTTWLQLEHSKLTWLKRILSGNLKLQQVIIQKEQSEVTHSKSYNDFKPTVEVSLSHQRTVDFSDDTSASQSTTGKISFSFALSPFYTYHDIEMTEADYQSLHFEEAQTRKTLERDLDGLLGKIDRQKRSLYSFQQMSVDQEEILQLYLKGLKTKHYSITQLTEAAKKYNDTKTSLIKNYFDIWEDAYRLFKLAGQLDPSQLALLNHFVVTKK